MTRARWIPRTLAFVLLTHTALAWSQSTQAADQAASTTAGSADEDKIVETLVVIGSRAGLAIEEITGHASAIDRPQIEALNKTDLQQLISAFTGVSINQQGGAGGVTSMYVRGGEANFAIVLIDGVQVNNPVDTRGGSFDFSTLDPSQIERIELVRGPMSAVYGADALSGVMNIVTRQPPDPRIALSAEVGQSGYYRAQIHSSGAIGSRTSFSLNLGRSDSGEIVEDSERELTFGNATFAWQATESGELKAGLRFSDSERSSYPEDSGGSDYAVWDELDQAASDALTTNLTWSSQANERWHYILNGSWHSLQSTEDTPGIYPGFPVPPRVSDVTFDRYQLDWINQLKFERFRLGFGLDAQREDGDSRGFIDFGFPLDTNFSLTRDSFGGFAEAYVDVGTALALSASLRYDDIEQSGSELTSRLGLLWRFSANSTLRANWGEGFKPPSFFSLAHPLVGNPELDPERSESWEVGLEHHFNESWSIDLVYFDATYRDLIDFDDVLFTNVNRDRVDAHGVEFSARTATDSFGDFRLHGTWTETDIAELDQSLRGRPEWKWGAQWFYRLGNSVDLSAEYLWVDEMIEASLYTGVSEDYLLDAYNTIDLSLNWHVNNALTLRAVLSNALDEHYQQAVGFPSPGRFLRLGVQWQPMGR